MLLVHMLMHGSQPYAEAVPPSLTEPPRPQKGATLAAVVSALDAAKLDHDFAAY